jgi:hypothetical protein
MIVHSVTSVKFFGVTGVGFLDRFTKLFASGASVQVEKKRRRKEDEEEEEIEELVAIDII